MSCCRLMGEFRLSNNTSTERGWLIPTSGDPDYDEALDRLLSQWMRNVSGLSAGMVRPRWQKEQPPLLPAETNWCAFGVIGWSGDDSPAFTRQTDDGSQLWRHETIECMASFYGPAGMVYASRFRDGISVTPTLKPVIRCRGCLTAARLTRFSGSFNTWNSKSKA